MSDKLCVCVPTYNNLENVMKYVSLQIDIFEKWGIDVHIYDSSENDEIRSFIVSTINSGHNNLFYHSKESRISSNEKVFTIYQEMENTEYEYIWMIHDHTVCSEAAIVHLLECLRLGEDFYVINMQADDEGIKRYSSIDNFLLCSAWRLNSYGAAVIRRDTFLSSVNWKHMTDKYLSSRMVNYSHIGFYFERASEISGINVSEILFNRKDFWDFNRDKMITWQSDILRICLECWGSIITALPDVYTNKQDVLKTQDRWFMSKYSLMTYKSSGIYNIKTFMKYSIWIWKMYPKEYFRDFLIALLPMNICRYLFLHKFVKMHDTLVNMKGNVYIFGAGRHGIECAHFMKENGLSYDGFLVTSISGNPTMLEGRNVLEINEAIFDRPVLVVVAVLTSGLSGVESTLTKYKKLDTQIYYFGER